MKTINLKNLMGRLLLLGIALTYVASLSAAPITCETIAKIKEQADKTEILYTGTATTTFYNGNYNGIFIQDETGGIWLYGINSQNKTIKTNMKISNITAKFSIVDNSPKYISIASKDIPSVAIKSENAEFAPAKVKMADFMKDPKSYEFEAIVIEDSELVKIGGRYFMVAGTDTVEFKSSNIATYMPKSGEFAGCYTTYNNRFMLSSVEHTNPKAFFSFKECQGYYTNIKPNENTSYKIDGSLIVNYVYKQNDNKNVIFAEYPNNQTTLGITIKVDGETKVEAGDKICNLQGTYTAPIKDYIKKEFKGGLFCQAKGVALEVESKNNELKITKDVNISDLLTFKLANDFHAKLIASRYIGKLTSENGKFKYTIQYEVSVGGEDDNKPGGKLETVVSTIDVVGANGTDLNKYVDKNVIIRGIYDAKVVYEKPTLIVRSAKDIEPQLRKFASIKEMIDAGQPVSKSVIYELTNELTVTYVKTQNNTSGPQTWAFVEDESGTMALDLGTVSEAPFAVKDKIKGVKGTYNDGTLIGNRIGAYRLAIDLSSVTVSGKADKLNYTKTTLKEVLSDSLKFASSLVEIHNVKSGETVISDLTGTRTDFFLYDTNADGDTIAVMHYTPRLHIEHELFPVNIIKALVNYNCLDGYYVIYSIEVEEQKEIEDTAIENNEMDNCRVYTSEGSIIVECEEGEDIKVYNVQGQLLYSAISASDKTYINNMNGMAIIKVGNGVCKVFVK